MVVDRLSAEIWAAKYRFSPVDCPEHADGDYLATISRVATALAAGERDSKHWRELFIEAMRDFRFIPAGRVLAGAGTGRDVTLFNCFVMGTIPDDLGGIFEHLLEAALTMQQGGGVGMDFSTIRPAGALVLGVGAEASGPLSFMDCWDSMCGTVQSAGARRGAMMGCLAISHPDIEAFIEAKRDGRRLRNFNLSVLVGGAFMRCLDDDGDWPLEFGGKIYRSVRAREMWDSLMRTTYDCAEPGVIFIDRVNAMNNLAHCEDIRASNPCGEQMLPPYGACLLGSINLAQLVTKPFEDGVDVDEDELSWLTRTAVRMLDNVIDVSRYPLPAQEAEAKAKRRIGLGITGLADALLFCGDTYGSAGAIKRTRRWLSIIRREAYRESARLAAEKGAFPAYDPVMLDTPNLRSLDEETRALIAENGLRNGCLTSIAPTGTTSLLAGNVSSGIEPVFAYSYQRKIRGPDGELRVQEVEDYALRCWKQAKGEGAELPAELFVSAQTLTPADHLAMQAAAQGLIDSSISKTVNCPADISFENFADIYREGFRLGCKGLTTYRPNSITGSVLAVEVDRKAEANFAELADTLAPRQERLEGATYKLKWPDIPHAVYVTINDRIEGDQRRPFEMFINSKNMEHYAWTLALTRMISAVFRRGGDISFVAEELSAVFDPRGGAWVKGEYVPSLLAAIGGVIQRHVEGEPAPVVLAPSVTAVGARQMAGISCPQCGSFATIKQEGCLNCTNCGYSKCG